DPEVTAFGIVLEDVGAPGLVGAATLVHVGDRSHRHEHLLAVVGEGDVAGPVSAAVQPAAGRNVGDDLLLPSARLEIAVLVRKPDHLPGLADVDPARIGAGRMEGDPERLLQPRGEDLVALRLARSFLGAKDADAAWRAFREEQVAVRRDADEARVVEAARELLHLEPVRHAGPRILGALPDPGIVRR